VVTKKTSKRCESEPRFQKTCHFGVEGACYKCRRWCRLWGLLNILSLEDSVSLLVGPGLALLTPLTFWASNSLAGQPGLQDSRIAKSVLMAMYNYNDATYFEK